MSFLEALGGIAGSGVLGAVGGIAKSWIDGRNAIKEKKLDYDHERHMSQAETELARLQMTHEKALTTVTQEFELDKADLANLAESFDHDAAKYATVDVSKAHWSMLFVDFWRGITRPAVTWMLLIYLAYISLYTIVTYGPVFDETELTKMTVEIVHGLIYTSIMATGWWFGSRPSGWRKK